MAEFQIIKRTVTYTNEDASNGSGVGYEVIPYPEAATEPDENKESPTITLTPNTVTNDDLIAAAAANNGYYEVTVAYNGDGELYVDYPVGIFYGLPGIKFVGGKMRLYVGAKDDYLVTNLTVRSTTTDTCNPASATFTITD